MEVRSRQDAKTVCIKRRHGVMSPGEILEEESFFCYVKAAALIGLRGREGGGKRRRERSSVAAALSKIGAGVALLVREVGVALYLCFYSGRRNVCLLSLLRGWFHVVEIGRVPSMHNIRSVSTMTTADIFFFLILWRMGKNKALARHTSTYFHTADSAVGIS